MILYFFITYSKSNGRNRDLYFMQPRYSFPAGARKYSCKPDIITLPLIRFKRKKKPSIGYPLINVQEIEINGVKLRFHQM
jgi:hypothetical protein